MLYPQSFMDNLRAHFLVSEVVGKRVSLRRHGREFTGLCPFHKEKTPSFTVNDEKGFYHCFGCGSHGDAIGFVKEYEGISYREAIERLAGEAGMALPQPSREEEQKDKERKDLQDIAEAACAWFESQLQSASAFAARDYIKQRGLSEETISRFRIGFAPDSQDAMVRALKAEGISEQQMLAAGLIIQPEGRAAYARFRARLMFPIRDKRSRVVAFGGRVLPGMGPADAPKYLNSPETELFKKGQMLFNYDLARKPAMETQQVIVCEGYMDVIALSQAGLPNAVAPLGTAVTAAQLQQLWQLCDAPSLCLDGDAAGMRAMQRVSELALPLLMPGKTLSFIRLPQGEDPDTLVRTQGIGVLKDLALRAPTLAEIIWQHVTAQGDDTPESRAGQEHHLMQLAEQIQNQTVKAHFRSYFKQQFWSRTPSRPATSATAGNKPFGMKRVSVAQSLPHLPQPHDIVSRQERAARACLALALAHPWLLKDIDREEFVACLALPGHAFAALRDALLSWVRNNLDHASADLFWAETAHQSFAETSEMLMRGATIPRGPATAEAVLRSWSQAVNAWHLAELGAEMAQYEQELSVDLSEQSLARILAYKQHLEQLEKERDRLMIDEMQD